jgi:hypothetical protein
MIAPPAVEPFFAIDRRFNAVDKRTGIYNRKAAFKWPNGREGVEELAAVKRYRPCHYSRIDLQFVRAAIFDSAFTVLLWSSLVTPPYSPLRLWQVVRIGVGMMTGIQDPEAGRCLLHIRICEAIEQPVSE